MLDRWIASRTSPSSSSRLQGWNRSRLRKLISPEQQCQYWPNALPSMSNRIPDTVTSIDGILGEFSAELVGNRKQTRRLARTNNLESRLGLASTRQQRVGQLYAPLDRSSRGIERKNDFVGTSVEMLEFEGFPSLQGLDRAIGTSG